jgi:hypothetical protein
MRFGQLMATLGLLAEDTTGHSLWEVEDTELLSVIDRFREDLLRRERNSSSEDAAETRAS